MVKTKEKTKEKTKKENPQNSEDSQPKVLDRIVEFRRVRIGDLLPNEKNFRTHPARQRAALRGLLETVGFVGAELVYKVKEGGKERLKLLDGHARKEVLDEDQIVPVLVTDLSEEDADLVLSSYDAVSDLAETDEKKARSLLTAINGRILRNRHGVVLTNMFNEALGDALGGGLLELDGAGDDEEGVVVLDPASAPPSHVKMAQLYLSVGSFPLYEKLLTDLAARYGKDNPTEAILATLENELKVSKKPTQTVLLALCLNWLRASLQDSDKDFEAGLRELRAARKAALAETARHGANKGKTVKLDEVDEDEEEE